VILALPLAIPVAKPPAEEIVAIEVVPLLHVPPDGTSERVSVAPTHDIAAPLIEEGNGFTRKPVLTKQPVAVKV